MTTILDFAGQYDYVLRVSLILCIVALGVHVLLNAGVFAVPQMGLMAVGGYVTAVLSTRYELDPALAIPLAVLASTAVGLALGAALVRLDGIYLAIATIAFNEIVRVTIRNLDITGGAQGLVGVPRWTNDLHILLLLGIAIVVLVRVGRTRFGAAVEAMREDPLVAAHQGVNLGRYRLLLFAVAGLLAGLGGALDVHLSGYIEPTRYSFDGLVPVLAITILGGMTSAVGPLLGGVIVFGVPEFLSVFDEYRELLGGIVIVFVIVYAPGGLVGVIAAAAGRFRQPSPPSSDPPDSSVPIEAVIPKGPQHNGSEAAPLLVVEGVSRSFGGLRALNDVSLTLDEGELFGLVGPNGSGKTTLLNVLSGVYRPSAGSISVDGRSLAGVYGQPHLITAHGLARTFQGIRLVRGRSVLENVMLGAYRVESASLPSAVLNLPSCRAEIAALRRRALAVLREFDIDDIADRDVAGLPYGPQRKVEIARALMPEPRLLLLDEPTAGMTITERQQIFDLIHTVSERGITVVVVEHDIEAITEHCSRMAVLNFGEVIAEGEPRDVFQVRTVMDAYIGQRAHD